ncbi:Ubiquitin-like-specific protease 2 [Cytospora mali]|uniref:Ubiquitin-like-specific protease 2 n=1 Tax=Cytospora mali TaxID=578113 RepID=A0A194VIX8_CYTMA|nr:Ubiquitin-like-specific protease 2 [Valsa mali]
MMRRGKEALGHFWFGNKLSGGSAPTEPKPTTSKRASDAPPTKPPKRQRIEEDDVSHDVCSVPSSSEVVDQPRSTDSSHRKGPQDSHSLRSTGDRRSSGVGVGELRSIDKKSGLGTKRSRHKNSAGRPSFGSVDESLEHLLKTTPPNAYNSKRLLHQLREPSSDPVQDDDDVTLLKKAPSSGLNGRAGSRVSGKPSYTASTFTLADESSDDELSAPKPQSRPRPSASRHQPVKQNQALLEEPVKSGRKRAAELDGDEEERLHLAKRRPEISSRADMHKTQPRSRDLHARGGQHVLHVTRAVCEPTYVYPAEGSMHENMPGASNRRTCLLVPVTNGPLRFEAVDEETGKVIPELKWMTSNIAKFKKITSNQNSTIVQIIKLKDFTPPFSTGQSLYLEFEKSQQAKDYIRLCCNAHDTIDNDNDTFKIMDLSNMFQAKIAQIMRSNMQKPPPPSTTERADDIQVMEHNADRKMATRVPQPHDQQSRSTARVKPVRDQMKDNDTSRYDAVGSSAEPKQTLTPALEKHIRDVVDDECDSGHQQLSHDNAELYSRTPSRPHGLEHEPQSQRSLRSTKSTARSPSPVLERWTKKHQDWAHMWNTDLVYERTTVGKGDIERLDEGQLLNDEIIFFYIKYLHKQLEKKDKQLANKVYVFNSFFWDKLKSKRGDINYDGVKNWTAKIDLISFDYIIVPINENAHWYLAIICNAKGLLHKEEPEPEMDGAVQEENPNQTGDGTEGITDDSVKKIATDVSLISIDDESVESAANHPKEEDKSSAVKNPKPSRKGSGPRKYDPKAPKVITLDSLGGPHSSVVTALKRYLKAEIKDKKGLDVDTPTTFGTAAKDIPCQPNFTDCGVYLLGYMQEFMKDPDRFTSRILQSHQRDWDVNAPALRSEIRELIFRLQKEYQDGEDHKKRQKALAKKQAPKPQSPETPVPEPPSQVVSDQQTKRSSTPIFAAAAACRRQTPRAKTSPPRDVREARSVHRGIYSLPPRTADDEEEPSSSQSQSNGPEDTGNLNNVSMIVNFNESIERNDKESISKPRVILQQPIESIESDDSIDNPAPSRPPELRQTPHSSDAKRHTPAPGVYEQRLLAPIPSSPASSDTATKRGNTSRAGVSPGQTLGQKPSITSPYFRNAKPGSGSIRKHAPAQGRIMKLEAIPSDTEGDGAQTVRKKPSPTIDLTLE